MSVMGALVDGFLSRVWVAMIGVEGGSEVLEIEEGVVEKMMERVWGGGGGVEDGEIVEESKGV